MPYAEELKTAIQAAELAGSLIMEDYASFVVVPDAPASITTETDRRSQEIILRALRQAFPGDALRAEEETETLAQASHWGPRLWIIDPIDGTRGFARKNGEFAVMIGFVDERKPVVGVVLEPGRNRLTYASKGDGCWCREGQAAARRCRVSKVDSLQVATVTQSHSKDPRNPSPHVQALYPASVIETYSAGIKLALVARGEADIYLNTYERCHDWDICAGQVLVEEAGGRVTSLSGQEPVYGASPALTERGMLATNRTLHPLAMAALSAVRP